MLNLKSFFARLIDVEKINDPLLIVYVGSAGFLINILGLILFYGHSFNQESNNPAIESKYMLPKSDYY